MKTINKIYDLVNNSYYREDLNQEAIEIAKEEGYIIILGGSDDLFYAYGAKSYLTDYEEHGYGWDGSNLKNISDKALEAEAEQLGLKVFWCGKIEDTGEEIPNYNWQKQGSFSYTVKEDIEFKNFIVLEEEGSDEVYCTGIILKLPKDFKISESE